MNVTAPGPDSRYPSATRNERSEALAHFERVTRVGFGLTDDAAWERHKARNRRIWAAKRTAETCALCGEPIEGDVWRRSVYLGPGLVSTNRRGIAPVCEGCNGRNLEVAGRTVHLRFYQTPAPCEGCGRQVHEHRSRRWRRHTYCSRRCRQKARNARRRHRRATSREDTRCATCGEMFAPARSDARYCSPSCRQKAYRERKKLEDPENRGR